MAKAKGIRLTVEGMTGRLPKQRPTQPKVGIYVNPDYVNPDPPPPAWTVARVKAERPLLQVKIRAGRTSKGKAIFTEVEGRIMGYELAFPFVAWTDTVGYDHRTEYAWETLAYILNECNGLCDLS